MHKLLPTHLVTKLIVYILISSMFVIISYIFHHYLRVETSKEELGISFVVKKQ